MLVCSDRSYRFAVSAPELWATIGEVDQYRTWWPWLRRLDAAALAVGERWAGVIQPPLPYSVRFVLTIEQVESPYLVVAQVSGDIAGTARLDVVDEDGGCVARMRSELAPANRALQVVAQLASPVVRFGHDWVLDTGARQFTARALVDQ
jgi:uncharacterized protein YndB with AHSA1/START domain